MTDLNKGIIEINGFEINKDTTPLEIKERLKDLCVYHNITPTGKSESFVFHNVNINNRTFSIKLYFYLNTLESIRFDYTNEECYSFEELFKRDCEWIKTILGEASILGKNGVVYAFDKFQISVTYQPDDGRCGADEFINLHYERG